MSEVTDVRKLEIFKYGLKCNPTLEEFEAILIDCATNPNQVLGLVGAGKIQEIFLDQEMDQDTRLAIIESDAYSMIAESLVSLMDEFSKKIMNKDRGSGLTLNERQRREREVYENKARDEMRAEEQARLAEEAKDAS